MNDRKKQNSINRSTLYDYLHYHTDLVLRYMKKGRGTYKVFTIPEEWEKSYLLVNDWRITDFQALVIFTNELVVRFGRYNNSQINIPYRTIDSLEVREKYDIPYEKVYLNKEQ